jgi:hypothetical protein
LLRDFALKPDPPRRAARRFRRTRVLVVGCGDVGLRVARDLRAACACWR